MALQLYRGDVWVQLGFGKLKEERPAALLSSWDDYFVYIKSLKPSDWKSHDHYRVLRLEHRRYEASVSEIQKSYRDIARRLHPDKCPGSDFFYCNVIRSAELMLDAGKRRAFDSVDPSFDESVPEVPRDVVKFFALFGRAFEMNARFAVVKPVPLFGGLGSSRDHVNEFYRYWFSFRSWREFSYLDEEDKTTGQDRYERKAIEKTNKVERKKREKEDAKRIHGLVQRAFDNDPRIKAFKEQDRCVKRERKQQKLSEARKQAEKEAEKTKQSEQPVVSVPCEAAEAVVVVVKKPLKPERTKFKAALKQLFKSGDLSADRLNMVTRANRMMYGSDVDALEAINQRMKLAAHEHELERVLVDLVEKFEICEREQQQQQQTVPTNIPEPKLEVKKNWSSDEVDLLVKGVRAYPAGTAGRWNVITDFINRQLKLWVMRARGIL